MKKFNAKFKIGTKVWIAGFPETQIVESFSNDRKLVTLKNVTGSFQRAHILKFSNKAVQ